MLGYHALNTQRQSRFGVKTYVWIFFICLAISFVITT